MRSVTGGEMSYRGRSTAALALVLLLSGYASHDGPVDPVNRVTILYDAFGKSPRMKKDWGYSALIEHGGKRILFDTGNNPEIFAQNVKAAGVDLQQLDFVVISHRHLDHTAGLNHLLSVNPTGRNSTRPRRHSACSAARSQASSTGNRTRYPRRCDTTTAMPRTPWNSAIKHHPAFGFSCVYYVDRAGVKSHDPTRPRHRSEVTAAARSSAARALGRVGGRDARASATRRPREAQAANASSMSAPGPPVSRSARSACARGRRGRPGTW